MVKVERNSIMFSHYQEITLLPDTELSLSFLWTKVFTQLHIAFAEYQNIHHGMPFAVSFPEYDPNGMGKKLRVFGETKEELEQLDIGTWLSHFSDYIDCTSIRPVTVRRIRGYAVFSRYQPDSALDRKAERYARRHEGTTIDEAKRLLKTRKEENKFPYIQIRSISTGESFSLFICKRMTDIEVNGRFGTYGLSRLGTVPEF